MKIRIHRGSHQIGGTCIEIAEGDTHIALDLGLPLDGDPDDVSLFPAIDAASLACVLISHPHIDHYGLLHHLPATVPVAMGEAARAIVRTAAPFTRQALPALVGPTLRDHRVLEVEPFRITPFLIDHSAFDAYSLLIEADSKRIFYSGDFRAHGRKSSLFEQLISEPLPDIDVLLMEGSSLSRLDAKGVFPTEDELEEAHVACLRSTKGLVMAHVSAQNIDRIVTLYRAARRTGRTLVIDLYTAAVLAATGRSTIPQSHWDGITLYVPEYQRLQIKREGWFDLLATHSSRRIYREELKAIAPHALVVFRPAMMRDLEVAGCLENTRFIYGQWRGYLDRGSYAAMEAWLARHNIPIEFIHTSGHASPVDLRRFASAMRARRVVPIHTFEPELYPTLFDGVEIHSDGVWWDA